MVKTEPRTTSSEQAGLKPRGLAGRLCLALTLLSYKGPLRRYNLRTRAVGARFESSENYIAERVANVSDYKALFFRYCSFRHKTVMELGCSTGYLLDCFLQEEEFTAIGVDIDARCVSQGRALYRDRIQFVQSTAISVPLPDDSVDVIYCVDTVEHLSRPHEILQECCRVLRPGGQFLIHFHPWLGPYASHLEDIIPLPWMHVFFSMETLLRVAAHVYDSEEYVPACYWFENGVRRPNPYLDRARWEEFLNQMTIADFRRLIRSLPYHLRCLERVSFGGKAYPAARFARFLGRVPLLDEFFLKAVFCVVEKPDLPARQPSSG